MSIQSPTGILNVTNATIRAGKVETTDLVVSGGFDMGAISSNADVMVDFGYTRQERKYPREKLEAASQNGYVVTSSAVAASTEASNAFIESAAYGFVSASDAFTSAGTATSNYSFNGIDGPWLKIQLANAVSLQSFEIYALESASSERISSGYVWASNDDSTWTQVATVDSNSTGTTVHVGSNVAYEYFALHVTGVNHANGDVSVGEWKLHGYETTGGDGQDLILRTHINAPSADFLEVHYDANVSNSYPGSGTTLTDLSSATTIHNGVLNNGVGFDSSDNSLTFNGTNQNVNTQALALEGDYAHSVSLWIKPSTDQNALSETTFSSLFYIGEETSVASQAVSLAYRRDSLRYRFESNDVYVTSTNFAAGEWVHLVAVYRGGGGAPANRDVYVNGVKQTFAGSVTASASLDLQTGAFLRLGAGAGTNAAPSEPFGGNIANFRLHTRPLARYEVLQLYDWEKVRFGRVDALDFTLTGGRVGLGTAYPGSTLDVRGDANVGALSLTTATVMDEAHESEEFPPRAMTGYETYMDGHGVFKASASSYYTAEPLYPWKAFDKELTSGTSRWVCSNTTAYSLTSPYGYIGGEGFSTNGILGEWLQLELPYAIKLSHTDVHPQDINLTREPASGYIFGSNNGESWTVVTTFSGKTYAAYQFTRIDVNATTYYKFFRMLITNVTSNGSMVDFGEWRLFGTRERIQSTLHDGELKLTKNITVPRIGPTLNGGWASQTPRRDHLVVEYDTSTYLHNNKAIDSSGNELHGTFYNGAYYDATEKALVFDGVNDYLAVDNIHNPAGAWAHSVSVWLKMNNVAGQSSGPCLYSIGETATNKASLVYMYDGVTYDLVFGAYGDGIKYENDYDFKSGTWYHMCFTYAGGTLGTGSQKVYVNGVELAGAADFVAGGNGMQSMDLAANAPLYLSKQAFNHAGNYINGSMSNFKLYDIALGPGEVRQLYEMGRNGPGNYMNIVDTAVAIGRHAPQAQLDVSGKIRANGANTNFTGQHRCSSAQGPLEKGLVVSASKNAYRNITGGLSTGPKAITIDESLPVVSLSNVTQDKACFGVVSRMEEANTLTRSETVGGLISEDSKVLGDNRVIVNSVGEGAIWVCDANGPLESGDYITTSNVTGYGQKQDGEFLANYTVAKITMDCDFTASNVAVQAIKKVETLKTVTQDVWEGLSDYDRSSNTETQYINESNVVLSVEEYESLAPEEQNTYSETTIQTYYQIQRGENILDEHGMLQWEDTGATEPGYELRYLDASGQQTDEANCVHRAAFVGCTYHCG